MIGIFDSGVGGLTLLREILATHPHASFHYLADSAHIPYGDKSPAWIKARCLAISEFLIARGATSLIVACHTASVICGDQLRKALSIPVLDMMTPSLEMLPQTGTVAILATHRTTKSGKYPAIIRAIRPELNVISLACPDFVPLVEAGKFEGPEAEAVVRHSLASLEYAPVDWILLACTHYPLLIRPLTHILGKQIAILNPAENIPRRLSPNAGTTPSQFWVTGDVEEFRKTASIICSSSLQNVNQVTVTS